MSRVSGLSLLVVKKGSYEKRRMRRMNAGELNIFGSLSIPKFYVYSFIHSDSYKKII